MIVAEEWGNNLCIYVYDSNGSPIGMRYRQSSYAVGEFDTFWAYEDYKDDGEIFNGSYDALDYVTNTLTGGIIGGIAGGFVGVGAAVAGSTFSLSIPTIGLGMTSAGTAGVVVGTAAVSVSGGVIVAGSLVAVGAVSAVMFAKGNGPRMGHNQYENKQFNDLCSKYRLNPDQRKRLHNKISGKNLDYHGMEDVLIDMFHIARR